MDWTGLDWAGLDGQHVIPSACLPVVPSAWLLVKIMVNTNNSKHHQHHTNHANSTRNKTTSIDDNVKTKPTIKNKNHMISIIMIRT